jgi:hypothetical protein
MSLPLIYQINDSRLEKLFQKKTFSNFLKIDVNKAIQKTIIDGKIEESCNWGVEMVISGYTHQLYEKLILLAIKVINVNNPRLPHLLYRRYEYLYNILNKKYNKHILLLRNDQQIRNHITELICILCKSNKGKPLGLKKINQSDFNIDVLRSKLEAKSSDYIKNLYRPGDPNEFKIITNEFYYHLTEKNYDKCVYWLSWINEWEKKMIKKEGYYKCGYRELKNIDVKLYTDYIWFFWEILLKQSMKLNNDVLNHQIQSLYKLFKLEYKPSKKSKRMCMLLNAIKYFTEYYNINNPIILEYYWIVQACGNINYMYNQKKQYEITDKSEMQHKLNQLNKLSTDKITKKSDEKKHKIKLSEDSTNKLNLLSKIDSMRFK